MAEKVIHYEDNIFFLHLQVKTLKDGIKLDLNAGFFIQKIIQDIFFYANTIDHIYRKLKSNPHLLKRSDYLKNMERLKKNFNGVIDDILSKRSPLSQSFESYADRLLTIARKQEDDVFEIKAILKKNKGEKYDQESIVSAEEFKYLMAQEEENS
ncbi:MAG: hypothetical protein JXB88_08675 [Spirochaetales bacterium]|nr:hypothetical protein [Spirochaetales bacterium]